MLRSLLAFHLRDWRSDVSYPVTLFMGLFVPAGSVLSLYFMAKLVPASQALEPYGGEYFAFAVVGMIVLDLQSAFSAGPAVRLRGAMLTGTLEATCASPVSDIAAALGSMLNGGLMSLMRGVVMLTVALALGARFQLRLDALAPVLVVSLLSLTVIGLFTWASVLVFQKAAPATFVLGGLTALVSGFWYPVSVLPQWLQWVAYALPTTAILEGVRQATYATGDVGPPVRWMIVFALVGLPVGVLAVGRGMGRARRRGTLGSY